MNQTKEKAVITGLGFVSPLANTKDGLISKLKNSQCANMSCVDFDGLINKTNVFKADASAINESDAFDPVVKFGFKATEDALSDAGLINYNLQDLSIGVVLSSSKGGVFSFDKSVRCSSGRLGTKNLYQFMSQFSPSALSSFVSARYRITAGPVKSIVSACATGTHSIIEATRMIEDGEIDYCIAGASDASIDPLMLAGYQKMGAYSKNTILPYNKKRDGFIVGEGAGVVILENKAKAFARNARIYAQIDSFAIGQEIGHFLNYQKSSNTLSEVLSLCLKRVGNPAIDYVNTHGTATETGDIYEVEQIRRAFKRRADDINFSSSKSFMGHLLGASGAVELIVTALAMQNDFVPPTLGLDEQDVRCSLNLTPNKAVSRKIKRALSFSMGFGGQVGVVLMSKV